MSSQLNIRKTAFEIGAFRVDPMRNLLRKDSQSFPIEPRIMDVLCELAAHHGHVVTREAFISRLWNVEYGADESLTRAISLLRKTFKAGGVTEKYIETIPKRGYRLTQNAVVTVLDEKPVPKTVRTIESVSSNPSGIIKTPSQIIDAPVAAAPIPLALTEKGPAAPPAATSSRQAKSKFGFVRSRSVWTSLFIPVIVGIFAFNYGKFQNVLSQRATVPPSPPVIADLSPAVETYTEAEMEGDSFESLLTTTRSFGRSVAVMPFADMSANNDQEYFTDGMVEELLNELSEIPDLKVLGRSATFAYKGETINPRDVGETLNVSHIIDGSVRKQDNRVRVSAQLINTEDNAHIWSGSYDGTLDNVFELQERISNEIVNELKLVLTIGFETVIDLDANLGTE